MKPFDKKASELVDGLENQQYQEELMLGLQELTDEMIKSQKALSWHPDFDKLYSYLEDKNIISSLTIPIIKH